MCALKNEFQIFFAASFQTSTRTIPRYIAVRKIFAEREALAKTLSDTSGLVQNVGVMFGFMLGTVALFISLGIFRVDIASLWLVVGGPYVIHLASEFFYTEFYLPSCIPLSPAQVGTRLTGST